uniref:Putative peptidase n=1 Tax=viral metagenome TaxID=1070528 RepID=A0A6H1ZL43_9ZZZZ
MEKDLFYRSFEIDQRQIDVENRTIELSISSENPVTRFFGNEIILHSEDSIDFSGFNSALYNHNPEKIIGRFINPRVEKKRAYATLVFDNDELGETAMQKVISGSLKGASIGYSVKEFRELQPGEKWRGFEGPTFISTKTKIHEASLTPIAADSTVGIGRRTLEGINIIKSKTEDKTMTKEEVQAIINESIGKLNIPKAEDIATAVRAMLTEDAKPKMKIDTAVFVDLLGRAGAVSMELKAKVADMAGDGNTEIEILRAITEATSPPPDTTDKGDIGDGLKKKQTQRATITTFKGVEDKDFFASLSSPGISLS